MRSERIEPKNGKPGADLGAVLRQVRELTGSSLRKAAGNAQISPAYLSQLEAGDVRDPSPRVLHGLAQFYADSQRTTPDELYATFMTSAGYALPGESLRYSAFRFSPWQTALKSASPLTPDEEKAVIEYLAWYRSRNRKSAEAT